MCKPTRWTTATFIDHLLTPESWHTDLEQVLLEQCHLLPPPSKNDGQLILTSTNKTNVITMMMLMMMQKCTVATDNIVDTAKLTNIYY